MDREKFEKVRSEIIARAWNDPAFKKRLFKNPSQVFEEYGIHVPPNAAIQVIENTEDKHYFIFPQKPHEKLSESDLKRTAGNECFCKCR